MLHERWQPWTPVSTTLPRPQPEPAVQLGQSGARWLCWQLHLYSAYLPYLGVPIRLFDPLPWFPHIPPPGALVLIPHPLPLFLDPCHSPLSFKACGAIVVSRCLGRSRHGFLTHCLRDGPSGQGRAGCSRQLRDSCTAFKDLVSSAHNSSSYI